MKVRDLGSSLSAVELVKSDIEEIRQWIRDSGILAPSNVPIDKGHFLLMDKYNNTLKVMTIERMKQLFPYMVFGIKTENEVKPPEESSDKSPPNENENK